MTTCPECLHDRPFLDASHSLFVLSPCDVCFERNYDFATAYASGACAATAYVDIFYADRDDPYATRIRRQVDDLWKLDQKLCAGELPQDTDDKSTSTTTSSSDDGGKRLIVGFRSGAAWKFTDEDEDAYLRMVEANLLPYRGYSKLGGMASKRGGA